MSDSESQSEFYERLLAGSDSAACELVQRYYDGLLRLVEREMDSRLRRREDPEDIVQSAVKSFFCRVITGRPFRIDHSGELWKLLVTITHNKLLEHAAKARAIKRDPTREEHADLGTLYGETPTASQVAIALEMIEKVLEGLPPQYGDVCHLYLQGFTETEIAEKLDCGREAVRFKLKRIRERLTRLIEKDARD